MAVVTNYRTPPESGHLCELISIFFGGNLLFQDYIFKLGCV